MRKLLVVLVMLLSIVGCSKPQEIVEVKVEGASTASEMTFCKEGFCSTFENSEYDENDKVDVYSKFIEEMVLVSSEEELGDEWITVLFDEHTFTYYSNDMVVYDDVVYSVSNIDALKENVSYVYQLDVFGSKLYPLSDMIDHYEFMKIRIPNGYDYDSYEIYIQNEELKKQLLDGLRNIAVMAYGFTEYGAGGDGIEIVFDKASVHDTNGTFITVIGQRITTKEAACIGGKITDYLRNLPIVGDEIKRIEGMSWEKEKVNMETEYFKTVYVMGE